MELPADESAQAGQLGAAQAGQPSAPQAGQLNAAHHHAQPHLQTLDEAVNKFLNNAKVSANLSLIRICSRTPWMLS